MPARIPDLTQRDGSSAARSNSGVNKKAGFIRPASNRYTD